MRASVTLGARMSARVVSVVSGLLLSLLAVPVARADLCDGDPCEAVAAVRDVVPASSAAVPTDGVLVLQIDGAGLSQPQIRERVALTVTLAGEPVAGAIEGVDIDDLLIWRPAEPLQPESVYQATGSFTNPPGEFNCAPELQAIEFEFTTTAGPAVALDEPTLTVKPTFFDDPILSLTTAVCCNDAMAADQLLCDVSQGITWQKGLCAATSSYGYLRVLLTAATTADPASSGQWVRVLLQDGEPVASSVGTSFQREIDAPACLAIVQRSLATGESTRTEEQCIGDDRADELGVHEVDPSAELDGFCTTDLYTCEIRSGRWDPLQCTSWYPDGMAPPADDPGDEAGGPVGERGCSCTSGPPDAALGLLALAWLGRRRPRQRAGARVIVGG
jgi:MYXO-CTERM domain-containing protein